MSDMLTDKEFEKEIEYLLSKILPLDFVACDSARKISESHAAQRAEIERLSGIIEEKSNYIFKLHEVWNEQRIEKKQQVDEIERLQEQEELNKHRLKAATETLITCRNMYVADKKTIDQQSVRIKELEAVLRKVEWVAQWTVNGTLYICIWCSQNKDFGHIRDCEIARLLKNAD